MKKNQEKQGINLKPIAGTKNKLFVKPEQLQAKTPGGIILQEKPDERVHGIVVAISDADESGAKPTVKVGDAVLFSKFAGIEQDYLGTTYVVLKEYDIHAIILK